MSVNATRFLASGSDDTSLALKMYSGSYVEAPRSGVFLYGGDMGVYRKTVGEGKSWQFLMDADVPAPELEYTPGDELLGQAFATEEGTLTADKYVVAHAYVPRDQVAYSHFDRVGHLAAQHKSKIEREFDKRVFISAALAARTSVDTAVNKNGLLIHKGGNRVTRTVSDGLPATAYPSSATGAANLRADLRTLALRLDIDNVPRGGRWLFLRPDMIEVLLWDTTATLWSQDYQFANDIGKRSVKVIEGFNVYPEGINTTTNGGPFPDENITTGPTKYQARFDAVSGSTNGTPVALAMCTGMPGQAPVGLITFENVIQTVKYVDERLSWFMSSHILAGAGVMHPWCAGSIEVLND